MRQQFGGAEAVGDHGSRDSSLPEHGRGNVCVICIFDLVLSARRTFHHLSVMLAHKQTGRYVYQLVSDKFLADGLHLLAAFGAGLVLYLMDHFLNGKILKGLIVGTL